MPYANNTAFARQTRAYLKDKKRRLPETTTDQYGRWLDQLGEMMDWPDPKYITIADLESLEAKLMGVWGESTVAAKMTMLRDMLDQAGNKDAKRYKMLCSMQPAKTSTYLSEQEIARCRSYARTISNAHELIFSFMADNGLRPIDILRLTVQNARELLDTGQSMILGKGRKGGKRALLVLSPITREPLIRYLSERRTLPGADAMPHLLIRQYRGRTIPYSDSRIYRMLTAVTHGNSLDASPSDMRKTCGNRIYRMTRDVGMAAMILRHESPNTTFRHYIGANASDMMKVQQELARKTAFPSTSSQLDDAG